MSLHKKPLTPLEESGLIAHGLPIGKPSQLADAFRLGIAWALEQGAVTPPPNTNAAPNVELPAPPSLTKLETEPCSLAELQAALAQLIKNTSHSREMVETRLNQGQNRPATLA